MSKVQYHQLDVLSSVSKEDINLDLPYNVSFGVGGSIHVVSFYWSLEVLEWEFGKGNEFWVIEVSGGATVNNGGGFDDLIAHRKVNGNVHSSFIG